MEGYTDQRCGVMYRKNKDEDTVTMDTKEFEGLLSVFEKLKADEEYWHNEALKATSAMGEMRMKIGKLIKDNLH